jgi:hypothetical protein
MTTRRAHVYILGAEHDDYTQGPQILGAYTSLRKAKAAARAEAGVARLAWTTSGSVKTHRRFVLLADGPEQEGSFPWHYVIWAMRPE